MPGSLLYAADGSLVYGPASNRLLFKPYDPLILSPVAIDHYYGVDGETGWSQSAYHIALDGAAGDLLVDSTLGGGSGGALISGACNYAPYAAGASGRFRAIRFQFHLTATAKSRISSLHLRLETQMFWLIGVRGLSGIGSETKDFISTSNTLLSAWTDDPNGFPSGNAVYTAAASNPMWSRSWNDLNADQIAAGGEAGDGWSKAPNLVGIRYALPEALSTAFRETAPGSASDFYLWFILTQEYLPYLGDWEPYTWDPGGNWEYTSKTGWEIAGEIHEFRLELGQNYA